MGVTDKTAFQRMTGARVLASCLGTVLLAACGLSKADSQHARGSQPLAQGPGFGKEESVGIFVGVRVFPEDQQLQEVPYAVDDAVDLAYMFSHELGLIVPERVYLLISGDPQKRETKDRLQELVQLGAQVGNAKRSHILKTISNKSSLAGPNGLLVVSFATHGFNHEGVHYLMSQDSLMGVAGASWFSVAVGTGISRSLLDSVLDGSPALRRIVLLDACRQHLVLSRSSVAPDPRSAMPITSRDANSKIGGAFVLVAARPGGYAFDDPQRRNGVFTRAILDGLLRCAAPANAQDFITIQTLATYVDGQVADWVREHRGQRPGWEIGIQTTFGGVDLPLASCRGGALIPSSPAVAIAPPPLHRPEDLFRDSPAEPELSILTGCASLELDLDRGTLHGLGPSTPEAMLQRSLPCEAPPAGKGFGLNSISYSEYGFRFSPDRSFIEVDESFQGKILANRQPMMLMGSNLASVIRLLGEPSQRDNTGISLYDRDYGCLQVTLSPAGIVDRVIVHGQPCHAVPLASDFQR